MLVSIGMPVRNGADHLEAAVRSVLAQDHAEIEVVISDNASTDDTEELCRLLAKEDSRVVYHRQPRDLHVVGNFEEVLRRARGPFFRWMGDDDRLEPNYVSRALVPLLDDERLILVTTEVTYTWLDGTVHEPRYHGTALLSDDPVDRLEELCDVWLAQHLRLDPLYGLMRRERVAAVPRPRMIREDEVFAARLALAAPWGHVPEPLAHRHLRERRLTAIASMLGVPAWTARFATTLQFRAIHEALAGMELSAEQRGRARTVLMRAYWRRQQKMLAHRSRKLAGMATRVVTSKR